MDLKMFLVLTLSLLPLLLFVSCRHGYDDDGIPIIFQHRFWNYYERGLARALRGYWHSAADDFQVALGEKAGALYPGPEEKRRTKMYGLRYFDDYFPNRELGICYYFLGQLENAEEKLETSLDMLPSSRAKFYYNKVKKAQLSSLKKQPAAKLAIIIDWPEDRSFIHQPQLTLSGRVTGNIPIEKIWINHRRQLFELAVKEYDIHERIRLSPGKNVIRVEAQDLLGHRKTWEKDVDVDLKGPEVTISSLVSHAGERVRVDVTDSGGIRTLSINEKPVPIQKGTNSYSTEMDIDTKSTIKVKAQDRAGNSTSVEHSAKDLRRASLDFFKTTAGRKLAYRPDNQLKRMSIDAFRTDVMLAEGLKVSQDDVPPVIRLYPEIKDVKRVTTDYYVLDLEVRDSGGIANVVIDTNGGQPGGTIERTASGNDQIMARFSEVISFEEEEKSMYPIAIIAHDHFGNVSKRSIELVRKRPHNRIQDYRLTLAAQAVAPKADAFAPLPRLNRHVARLMNRILLGADFRRFTLVDRSKKVMHKLALEHILIHSDLADLEKAVRSGKLRVADWYLRAVAVQRSGHVDEENWEIYGNLLDVRTGELIMTAVVYTEGTEDLEFILQLLIEKLYQDLPLHADTVREVRNNSIVVELGTKDGMKRNFRWMFVPESQKDDPYAEPLVTTDDRWIQGIVTEVQEDNCKVVIEPKGAIQHIQENDLVFMR